MSKVCFISDLHLGHSRILDFSGNLRFGETVDEHDEILVDRIASSLSKRDTLWVLGDVAFSLEKLFMLKKVTARMILVRGNHDTFSIFDYLSVFDDVYGICKKSKHWLSHAPVHPAELRGCTNIHGHVHASSIRDSYHQIDSRYVNVCVEACEGYPVNFQDIKSGYYQKHASRI